VTFYEYHPRLELEKKQKQETELKYRDEREQIEAKIKQLQEEISNKCDLERSLRDDIQNKENKTPCNT
jgi:hypothetical protein